MKKGGKLKKYPLFVLPDCHPLKTARILLLLASPLTATCPMIRPFTNPSYTGKKLMDCFFLVSLNPSPIHFFIQFLYVVFYTEEALLQRSMFLPKV